MILLAARREALALATSKDRDSLASQVPSASWAAATLLSLLLTISTNVCSGEPLPRTPLWEGTPPVGSWKGAGDAPADENAFITVHLPEQPNGAAVVICPGGGYGGLVVDGEGHGIARWLNLHGIAGIVLEYRLPRGRAAVPSLDAAQALRTTRQHADEWKIDSNRIGVIGFSAGGHLAATAATLSDDGNPAADQAINALSSRPDFVMLIYPVIDMGETAHGGSKTNLLGPEPTAELMQRFSPQLQVTEASPPAFLAHAVDDTVVPIAQSELFYDAYKAKGVPALLLRLPNGGHGLNGYKGPSWDAWQSAAITWLRERGMIPSP